METEGARTAGSLAGTEAGGGGIHRGSGLRERLYHTPQPERVPTKLPALT